MSSIRWSNRLFALTERWLSEEFVIMAFLKLSTMELGVKVLCVWLMYSLM